MISSKLLLKAFVTGAFFVSCSGPKKSDRPVTPVIPTPSQSMAIEGAFEFNASTAILFNAKAEQEALFLSDWLTQKAGLSAEMRAFKKGKPEQNSIYLNIIKGDTASEAYALQITSDHIWITAEGRKGIFYGIQTLRQLLPSDLEAGNSQGKPLAIDAVLIEDHPAFSHRGLLLDCCRHFMDKEFIKRMIDLLAYHKMNVLHWHLTEDQGWRIEIDAYPLLTEVGAWRTEADGTEYGGFYTKEDIREVVAYAASRHVTVIPEIELPGHSLAAIASYPHLSCEGKTVGVTPEWGVFKDIYCAGNDSVFVFLEKVLDEVLELFPSEYIHIGGDEAPKYRWENCTKCQKRIADEGLHNEHELQSYFISRIGKYLASKGRKIIGWDEILEGGLPEGASVQSWRGTEGGLLAAQSGHQVVMSPTSHCYFDYGLSSIDLEKVYSFDPIPDSLAPSLHSFILGAECNMWTERAPQATIDSKVFPRILAMAEVLWHYPAQRDFTAFQERVDFHYARLDALGVSYGPEGEAVVFVPEIRSGKTGVVVEQKKQTLDLKWRSVSEKNWEPLPRDGWLTPKNTDQQGPVSEMIEVKAEYRGKAYGEPSRIQLRNHLGLGADVKTVTDPSPRYSGGGKQALTDGILGSESDFNDGRWQGTFGENVSSDFAFKEEKTFQRIEARFFQYQNSWIFLPKAVEFHYSVDGKNWILAGTVKPKHFANEKGKFTESFSLKMAKPVRAGFVRMIALNQGPCPPWHDAAGQPSWLFCDELIID